MPKGQINDATAYYIDLIKNAFVRSNFRVSTFHKNDFELEDSDYIVVVSPKDFLGVYRRNRKAKIIIWFQGLLPEENKMLMGANLFQKLRFPIYNWMERKTIHHSYFNFFVSDRMKRHFSEKYAYDNSNFLIIPCYNKNLKREYFSSSIKPKTSFVYAGGIYPWQCFAETIAIYKEVERKNNNAFLTVLTKDQEKAENMIKMEGIKNYKINYVSLEEVMHELGNHKYGFLLREDNIVNNCATPTKMNTYLSAGLMPIHTYAVHSFNEHINLDKFEIKGNLESEKSKLAEEILVHDDIQIDYNTYYDVCHSNFKEYFDDTHYIEKITSELISRIHAN
ncbi:glycosyltransferase family 4 protein [Aggregatimonas sangjinii]|uniref:Glycosyltransferase family 4 protein n=1 Tax=Aggregatimonas sangjinii TaxID=2583587 RepID=A0A5B7SQ75_9FLAO|nr:glycosyltransferase family 4 protein [Aggregatimonas sangjinii]QCW98783.1 glycosyltransferase family 4 protein [Aggregatimonas sangjinii]